VHFEGIDPKLLGLIEFKYERDALRCVVDFRDGSGNEIDVTVFAVAPFHGVEALSDFHDVEDVAFLQGEKRPQFSY
jgi:hypothetical protein